ncbi:MAG: phenylacetate--CoA ligase family protein [Candidatus Hodarchaeales archaeon]
MIQSSLELDQSEKIGKASLIVLKAAKNSPLYKRKYHKIDLSNDLDIEFQKLPLLSRSEYYQGMKSPDFSLLTEKMDNSYIFTSGGTTGDVKLTAWSHNFINNWIDECYRSLSAVGLAAHDVIINLFFPGIWATHHLINKALEKANVRIIPLGGKISLDLLVEYIITYQVTALIGVPSFIVRLTEFIDSLPAGQKSKILIKKIFHAGEFLSTSQAKFIESRLNCEINPFIYSSTDTGTIGIKCPHSDTNQYHIIDTIFLETLDLDSGEPVPVGTPGEFVVTNLVNHKAPCIRYRVGDMGVINELICPCGNTTPLFTLIGRADDEVKVAGYLISPEIILKGIEKFPELSKNFQLIVEEEDQKAKLTVLCETLPSITINNKISLQDKIVTTLIEDYDILGVLISQGYCSHPIIQLAQPGKIPRNQRTGKIKRVRDLR